MDTSASQGAGSLGPVFLSMVILFLVARRMARSRQLAPGRLWLRPVIMVAGAAGLFVRSPLSMFDAGILIAAAGAGALAGWRQAKMMAIEIAPGTRLLNVKASPVAVFVLVGVVCVRLAVRQAIAPATSVWHAHAEIISNALLVMMAAFYVAQTSEMFVRGKTLLAESITAA